MSFYTLFSLIFLSFTQLNKKRKLQYVDLFFCWTIRNANRDIVRLERWIGAVSLGVEKRVNTYNTSAQWDGRRRCSGGRFFRYGESGTEASVSANAGGDQRRKVLLGLLLLHRQARQHHSPGRRRISQHAPIFAFSHGTEVPRPYSHSFLLPHLLSRRLRYPRTVISPFAESNTTALARVLLCPFNCLYMLLKITYAGWFYMFFFLALFLLLIDV